MKRIALCLALVLCCVIAAAAADTLTSGDFTYELLPDGGAELISYTGSAENVTIPNTLDGHPVTAVRGNPFANRSVQSVRVAKDHPCLATINGVLFGQSDRRLIFYPAGLTDAVYSVPDGILEIGDRAFLGNTTLIEIRIPDSVTKIGIEAFRKCSALETIWIPDSVTELGDGSLSICENLTTVRLSESLTAIPTNFMFRCVKVTSITIPDGVISIGGSAFERCDGLETFVIPEGVTTLGNFILVNSPGIRSVVIPASVTAIGQHCFDLGSYGSWYPNPDLVITVESGSFAESFCLSNGIACVTAAGADETVYGDNDSWLVDRETDGIH